MRRAIRWLAAVVLSVCGCHGAPPRAVAGDPAALRPPCRTDGDDAPLQRSACDKDWSVLVYMMADAPGLGAPALWNLHQMEGQFASPGRSAASTPAADVIVELDVEQPPGIRRLRMLGALSPFAPLRALADYAGPTAWQPRSPVVEAIDEARAEAPPATPGTRLADFLAWGIAHYPARHYAVIVWGHGFGFRPAGAPCCDAGVPRGGIALDVSHAVLDIPALRAALAETSAARLAGRPFDLYLSDACLMQTIEVAAELTGVARYIGGAEAKLDPLGLPYRLLVPLVNGSAPPPPASPRCAAHDAACDLAAALPDLVRTAVSPQSELYAAADAASDARQNLTYSVVDAQLLANRLVPALHALGAALRDYLREPPSQDDRRIAVLDLFTPHRPSAARPFVHAFIGGGRDIGSLLSRLRAQLTASPDGAAHAAPDRAAASLLRAIDAADAALRTTVIAEALGSRYDDPAYAGMLGLSAWLPYQAPDGTAGTASPWGASLRELFDPAPP
ncbi:MAG: hypothetical protein E6J91_03565 [Deltaproteobacteria bacterium]|nr:MAG: hypothetical protein E6J91_03565 [Deltaproteobacteria bacterium]